MSLKHLERMFQHPRLGFVNYPVCLTDESPDFGQAKQLPSICPKCSNQL